jgi:valyl-tRNA synthetase
MPYLTEELWQRIPIFTENLEQRPPSISVSKYPQAALLEEFNCDDVVEEVYLMNEVIRAIRSTRSVYNLPNKSKTEAYIVNSDPVLKNVLTEEDTTICALSYSKSIEVVNSKEEVPGSSAAAVISDKCTAYIILKGLIDFSKEEDRIKKKIGILDQQVNKLKEAMAKLDYESKVPLDVQESNAAKMTGLEGEVKQLCEALESIKVMSNEK